MNLTKTLTHAFLWAFLFSAIACSPEKSSAINEPEPLDQATLEKSFTNTLEAHLRAVSTKDLELLKSTMSPEGKMQLILPGNEIIHSVDSFLVFHEEWFQDTSWTFETKILSSEVGERIGVGITEVVYREPERNGKPYFNRMIVSYALERLNDQWYIISDHASSIEKTSN